MPYIMNNPYLLEVLLHAKALPPFQIAEIFLRTLAMGPSYTSDPKLILSKYYGIFWSG